MNHSNAGGASGAELARLDGHRARLVRLQVEDATRFAQESVLLHEASQLAEAISVRGGQGGRAAELAHRSIAAEFATALRVSDRTVQRQGEAVELTSTEFDLLLLLARAPGKVFSRDDILNQLRGHEAELYTRAVDIVVSRLRKKLEPLDCIKTLRNAGYTLALQRVSP